MKFKFISLVLMLSLCKISVNASAGVWDLVESIPTEPIYAVNQQEQAVEEIVEPKQPLCEGVKIEGHNGMKTWMPHNLFGKKTLQYAVQKLAVTDKDGFRSVNGRYCVAVGSGITTDVGALVDVILENGEEIPCVVSDTKADCHTDNNNIFNTGTGCCCEFVVDSDNLVDSVKNSGNVSSYIPEWDSPIIEFRVYKELNVLRN